MSKENKLSPVEHIKENSNYLRGTIADGLKDELTGAISDDDTQLIKFHGSYQQFDRETESERKKQKLEPLYQFMIRVRLAGGLVSPAKWLAIDRLADKYANKTIKLTTRQAFQLHGIMKKNLKETIRVINKNLMDTIAACGDVNRNVMCNANPYFSNIHEQVMEDAQALSDHFTPKTSAYYELWLNGDKVESSKEDTEPIYGKTYLPRKFKTAFAIPPYNDVDVYANDLGLIAIEENGTLSGYNIAIGGGMGMTFGNSATYPRLATVIGFAPREKFLDVAETIVKIQRDHGNRSDRKVARLKYTIDRNGLQWFKDEINQRLGWKLGATREFNFVKNGDQYGWHKGDNGKWHLGLFIEGGRVLDKKDYKLKTALKEVAKFLDGDFRLTGNQNLVIANVSKDNKGKINTILKRYGVLDRLDQTGLRLNSIACVALNTCSLAHAHAENYLPDLIDKLDEIIIENGLRNDEIIIRMTGCPNGCGRPYLGEIGFVGRATGKYNLYLGAGFLGERLNKLYKEMLGEEEILAELKPLIKRYATGRKENERFGDFVVREGIVKETREGKDFHD